MEITFWGSRGSIPVPGPDTVRVGGNTTCLEILTGDHQRIIVDAGTGLRSLGHKIVKEEDILPITMLMTHSHWDHLAGIIFFLPIYNPQNHIYFYGNLMAQDVLRRDIYERRDNRYYPVNMDVIKSEFSFHSELPDPLIVGDVKIDAITLNHPGNGYAFRFEQNGRKFAFATDNELGMIYDGGQTADEIRDFCRGLDLLIHDAQYYPSDMKITRGWGHSTYVEVADLAHSAGVPYIILTHHDPDRNDDQCDELLATARKYIADRGYKIRCDLAVEGLSLNM